MKFVAAIAISLFPAAPVSAMDLQPFRTPSDNIHCLFIADDDGQAAMVCHGDTLISPDAPVVDYRREAEFNGITCASEKSGLTCSNGQGHGFSLSRAKQRLF